MKKYPLMGKYVEVMAFMKPKRSRFSAREHIRYVLEDQRVGMVVGYRTVYDGVFHAGYGEYDDYTPGYLEVKGSIKVLLVCFWPTQKPVLVRLEDAHRVWSNRDGVPPKDLYYPNAYRCTEKDKEALREMMRDIPRDPRGRWTKA